MAQTTTDTAASTVSARAASSFSGGTGTEAEFGSLGALSPTWWSPRTAASPNRGLRPIKPSNASLMDERSRH